MNLIKKKLGYSLIEVVAVTMTSGVIAASALPHFVDLKHEARKVVFKSMQRSLLQAANMAHAQQRLSGLGPNDAIVVDGKKIAMSKGFPKAESIGLIVENRDFTYRGDRGWFVWNKAGSEHCRQNYVPPTAAKRTPQVTDTESGC